MAITFCHFLSPVSCASPLATCSTQARRPIDHISSSLTRCHAATIRSTIMHWCDLTCWLATMYPGSFGPTCPTPARPQRTSYAPSRTSTLARWACERSGASTCYHAPPHEGCLEVLEPHQGSGVLRLIPVPVAFRSFPSPLAPRPAGLYHAPRVGSANWRECRRRQAPASRDSTGLGCRWMQHLSNKTDALVLQGARLGFW